MRVRERVLAVLEENRGSYISGEALAKELSVSRNAVWKVIRQLQAAGHEITAVPNRGYQLAVGSQTLSPQSIARQLGELPIFPEVFSELPSTNTLLRKRAEEGAPEGTLLVAEQQTAGRGRFGRSFFSPSGGGIYMSLLLRPRFSAQDALCITTCAAVAVCRALEKHCAVSAEIKWVNDVFCHEKKVCGIATEASLDLESGGLHYAVLGIGINLFPSEQAPPAELSDIVGTVLQQAPLERDLRSLVIAEILTQFWTEYPQLVEKQYFADYERRCFVLGKQIDVVRGSERKRALALSLSSDFSLRVRYDDGGEELLSSGEVSLRPIP